MIHLTHTTYQYALVSVASTGAVLSAAIDTIDFDQVTILVPFGAIASSGDLTTFKLTECDTSGGSYSDVTDGDITDADIGTASLPAADDDGKLFIWEVDTKAKKRFLKLSVVGHASNSALYGILVLKNRGHEGRTETAAGVGAEAVVQC